MVRLKNREKLALTGVDTIEPVNPLTDKRHHASLCRAELLPFL